LQIGAIRLAVVRAHRDRPAPLSDAQLGDLLVFADATIGATLGPAVDSQEVPRWFTDQSRMSVDRELRIAETFVELADTLVADFDVIEFLHLVTTRCAEFVDVAATGVVLADPSGSLMAIAASDERARLLELFEMQNDEGPCRDCYQYGGAVVNIDLAAAADRLPHFAPGAQRGIPLG
jgi:hypothetical protein